MIAKAVVDVCHVDIARLASYVVAGEHMSDPSQRALYREVGSKIREARERLGLTQQSLAIQVSLSRTSITNIEQGRQTILVHQLVAFARSLNLEVGALLPAPTIAVNLPADIIQRLKPNDHEQRNKHYR